MLKKIFLYLIIAISWQSCSLIGGEKPCRDSKNYGKFDVFQKSKKIFDVYKNKKIAIFVDSLGVRDTFNINFSTFYNTREEPVYGQNCIINDFYEYEVLEVRFINKRTKATFDFSVNYYRKSVTDLKSERLDFFSCSSADGITTPTITYFFEIKSENEQLLKEEKIILNKKYSIIVPKKLIHTYYFNEEQGLVAIKLPDLGNRLMVLEKLE